jgi:ribosome-binding protein aMBF1 (putative translation factor)
MSSESSSEQSEVTALVSDRPLAELVRALVEAGRAGAGVDVEEIAERLEGEERNLLRSLAAGDALDEETALKTIDDTLHWLRRRRHKQEERALTEQLRDPDSDHQALLSAKDQHREAYAKSQPPPMRSPN